MPRLLLKSHAERPIVVLDGEELVGAKQNRIVNTSILVAPGAELQIPVSCVEQGRWDARSEHFGTQRRMGYAMLRAQKADQVLCNVRDAGTLDADQHAVWHDIAARTRRGGARSATGAMADAYAHADEALQHFVDAFETVPCQVGAAFTLHGMVVGLECFGRRDVAEKILPKLVQSYAMDALDADPADAPGPRPRANAVQRFMEAATRATLEPHEGVGDGVDLRLQSRTLTGLVLAQDGDVYHLSVLRRRGRRHGSYAAAMASYLRRSRR